MKARRRGPEKKEGECVGGAVSGGAGGGTKQRLNSGRGGELRKEAKKLRTKAKGSEGQGEEAGSGGSAR